MATNAEIQAWLKANPTATDAQIAMAMQQYGVTPAQLAQAANVPVAEVQARYQAATRPATPSYTAANVSPMVQPTANTQPTTKLTDAQIKSANEQKLAQFKAMPTNTAAELNAKYAAAKALAAETQLGSDSRGAEQKASQTGQAAINKAATSFQNGIDLSVQRAVAQDPSFVAEQVQKYNAGGTVDPLFTGLFDRLRQQFKQGQAAPGSLTLDLVQGAGKQWIQDAAPSALDKAIPIAATLVAGYLTGGAAAAAGWGPTATAAAAGAGAGATNTATQGGGWDQIIGGAVKGGVGAGTSAYLATGDNPFATTPTNSTGMLEAASVSGGSANNGSTDGGGMFADPNAGVGGTPQDIAGMKAWETLPPDAQQAYLDAGYIPADVGQSMLNDALSSSDPSIVTQATDWVNKTLGTNYTTGDMLGGLTKTAGTLLNYNSAKDAATTNANTQLEAARIAADAAKFRPVGVTTSFGSSNFGYDAKGNLTSAGYNLSPEARAQQTALYGMSNQALNQMQGAGAATAPMGQAAQTMFGLGQGYLGTSPQAQAQKYMADQQSLLAAPRADRMAQLQTTLNNQGRSGLAIGGNAGMLATNPEMAAYYNAIAQQDLGLAANATQGGMDYAKFGAGMVGAGGEMLQGMYGTQTASYDPYNTLLGGIQKLEGLGQNAMDLGVNIGAKGTASNAQAGVLLGQGMQNAASAMQPVNAVSPWGTLLSGAGTALGNYKWGQ